MKVIFEAIYEAISKPIFSKLAFNIALKLDYNIDLMFFWAHMRSNRTREEKNISLCWQSLRWAQCEATIHKTILSPLFEHES